MSQQVFPSAVAQRIVKFITNENVKPTEILMRPRAQFGNEKLPRTQVYDWNKPFEEGRTQAENIQRTHLLQGKLWPKFFWDSGGVLFIDFLRSFLEYE
jgi:hypothetical protein